MAAGGLQSRQLVNASQRPLSCEGAADGGRRVRGINSREVGEVVVLTLVVHADRHTSVWPLSGNNYHIH